MCTEAYVTRLGEIQAVKRLSGNTGRARDDLASPRSKASRAAACFQTSVFVSPRFLVPKRAALVALAFSTLDEIALFLCFREILKLIIRFEALSLSLGGFWYKNQRRKENYHDVRFLEFG